MLNLFQARPISRVEGYFILPSRSISIGVSSAPGCFHFFIFVFQDFDGNLPLKASESAVMQKV
jgi:hypothetical protein